MSALWLVPVAAVAAAVAFFTGRRAERGRWWPLFSAATIAVERHRGFVHTPEGPAEDVERLARCLAEVVRALSLHWTSSHEDVDSMRQALDGLGEGVVLLDPLGRVVYGNRPAQDIWRLGHPHVRGVHAIELFQIAEIDEALTGVRRDGQARTLEYRAGIPERTYEVRVKPISSVDGEGRPFVLVVLRDVTELRAVERMRRDFVANASHELRTPLTAIQGYAEALAEAEEPHPDHLEKISRNVEYMSRILDDMLVLARVESYETPFRSEPVDLATLSDETIDRMRQLFTERQLHIDAALETTLVRGDPDQLRHVVANLLSNALRYTPAHGRVFVATDRVSADGGQWGRIVVEDSGPGIPPEERVRIFERFYRVDKGHSRATGGTGLGLAIVKHVVLRHGGRVWAEGREGPGARFVCLLPADREGA